MKHIISNTVKIAVRRWLPCITVAFLAAWALFPAAAGAQTPTALQWDCNSTSVKTISVPSLDSVSYYLNTSSCPHFGVVNNSAAFTVYVFPTAVNSGSSNILETLYITRDDYGTTAITLTHLADSSQGSGSGSGGGSGGGNDPDPDPDPEPGSLTAGSNYIQKTTFTSAGGASYYRDVTYFDGLGYGVQALQIAGSPLGHTVATQTVWDSMHRPDSVAYLPYVRGDADAGNLDEGHALDDIGYWYSGGTNGYDDSRPFAVKAYETSSYGRPVYMQKEGDEWNAAGGHGVSISYGFNSEGDSLMRFVYVPPVESWAGAHPAQAACPGMWPECTLARTRTTDEAGAVTDTYTDVRGRTVCTRGWTGPAATAGGPGAGTMTETYCVYDLRDSLVLVVQPEGAAALRALPASSRTVTIEDNASNANNALYREYCFGYTWDGRGDLVAEHVPGGGTTERVYDARGRLVLETGDLMSSVDASLTATSQPRYVQTTYDVCDRVVRRRVVRTSTALGALRAACDTSANVPALTEAGFTQICLLYSAEYFPFSSVTDALTGFTAVAGVVTASDVETANVKGMLKSEVLYPAANADGTAPAYGGITRTKRYYYDYRGRVVQMAEYDSDGWSARYSTKYDFCGNVLASMETHTGADASSTSTNLLTTNYYDARGRITCSNRELDGMPLRSLTCEYDELGRLSQKIMGDGPDHIGYAAFDYDLHGWTTDIAAYNNWDSDLVFSETLRYAAPQKGGSTARYDGGISEITYTLYNGIPTPSSDTYGYDYDGLKRLTDAVHYAGAATTQSLLKTEKNITYDRNGNITGLNRYGAAGLSEMLSFTHAGNRLSSMRAWDGANHPQTDTFTYDAMGNQLTDSRKGLQFCYNFANLPSKVEGMAGSGNAGLTLNYGYLSDGTKTSSMVTGGWSSGAEGLKYRGAFVYELKDGAERLSSIAWSDGRIKYVYAPAAVVVDDGPGGDEIIEGGDGDELLEVNDLWHIPDHLGNTRAVVLLDYSGGTVLEQNEYLPFGTRLDGTLALPENRYRLGGKEEQRFGGLDLALSDFGARYYDPFTARWTTRDPLASKYHSWSPYNYCAGNPVKFYDDGGKDIVLSGKEESSVTIKTNLVDINADVSGLGIDWGGSFSFEGNDILSAALDLVGVVDATGIADALNAGIQAQSGQYFGATLSALSILPGGDLVKVGKVGKDIRIISDAISTARGEFKLSNSLKTNMERLGTLNKGEHAHHMLPKAFEPYFKRAGLNINDPKYGKSLNPHKHLSKAKAYNKRWADYFRTNPNANAEDIVKQMKKFMYEEYEVTIP